MFPNNSNHRTQVVNALFQIVESKNRVDAERDHQKSIKGRLKEEFEMSTKEVNTLVKGIYDYQKFQEEFNLLEESSHVIEIIEKMQENNNV